jgi:pimeloyl-ACP methyl ester carboxylesterase
MTLTASHPNETSGYLGVGKGAVYCTMFRPGTGVATRPVAALLLGAFAEERKSSVRSLVEMARALAAAGVACARIDFRGTGDSSARSEELSFGSMVVDTHAALESLATEFACPAVCLVGLRLGATVALAAALERPSAPAGLVLMEPVTNGERYVGELRRAQAIRTMLTSGSAAAGAEAEDAAILDLDGLAVARSFLDELAGIDLVARARESGLGVPALVMQIGPRAKPGRDVEALAAALGPRSRLEVVVAEPFWLQTDHVSPGSCVERLAAFVGELAAQSGGGDGR